MAASRSPTLRHLLRLPASLRLTAIESNRPFSVLNRPPPNYEGHVPLTTIERGTLAVASAVISLFNPRRAGERPYVYLGLAVSDPPIIRSHCSVRRNYVNAIFHLSASGCHARLSYWPPNFAREAADYIPDHVPYLSTYAST